MEEESSLGRALAGGHIPSVAKAIVKHSALREAVFLLFLDELDAECSKLCKRSKLSAFRKLPVSKMSEFEWKVLIDELSSKAPMMLQILCTLTSANDHRNKHKSGSIHQPGICMAASVILKERNREMCGVQSLISLLLFSSHTNKQVRCVHTIIHLSIMLFCLQTCRYIHN